MDLQQPWADQETFFRGERPAIDRADERPQRNALLTTELYQVDGAAFANPVLCQSRFSSGFCVFSCFSL
jgi:hypothetical protein